MSRPKADMRQKVILPTVFSNIRIGKLGKTRPWIFQTWAGLLSRSNAYGVFKWEQERIAALVWPYNTERQETFGEDMELLAEGSAEERVIQKYEVAGVTYGRFPHFEDHNAMVSRSAPDLPFPPGVDSPVAKPKPNTEMEYELERNSRLTEVNTRLTEVNPAVPAQNPKAKTNSCPHGWAAGPEFCPDCTPRPVIGGSPAPKNGKPATPKKLGFDPHELNESIGGYTAVQVRQIVRYHWDESENAFWREKTNSREFFERNIEKMAKGIPASWLNPNKAGKKKNSFMHWTS